MQVPRYRTYAAIRRAPVMVDMNLPHRETHRRPETLFHFPSRSPLPCFSPPLPTISRLLAAFSLSRLGLGLGKFTMLHGSKSKSPLAIADGIGLPKKAR